MTRQRQDRSPKISVGLPVFNGEGFLDEAISSLVSQTHEDLEIVISDNASTDRTEEICRKWAASDDRIRYYRSDKNRGAAWNFNKVFEESRGAYFNWAAHDDKLMPEFLAECSDILDKHPDVVLSYTRVLQIDENGDFLDPWSVYSDVSSDDQVDRLRAALWDWMCLPIFGLIRSDVLRSTGLIRPFHASDRMLLGELALQGKFYLVDAWLFVHREHPGMSANAYRSAYTRGEWWDPDNPGTTKWPNWLYHTNVARMISRASMSNRNKLRALAALGRLMLMSRKRLAFDLFRPPRRVS